MNSRRRHLSRLRCARSVERNADEKSAVRENEREGARTNGRGRGGKGRSGVATAIPRVTKQGSRWSMTPAAAAAAVAARGSVALTIVTPSLHTWMHCCTKLQRVCRVRRKSRARACFLSLIDLRISLALILPRWELTRKSRENFLLGTKLLITNGKQPE